MLVTDLIVICSDSELYRAQHPHNLEGGVN